MLDKVKRWLILRIFEKTKFKILENAISNIYFLEPGKNASIGKNYQKECREILELLQGYKFDDEE